MPIQGLPIKGVVVLQVSVNRRHLVVFTAVVASVVSVAWVGVAQRVSAASATPVVYVATGENFPDALGAGPAAAIVKGPILLVAQNSIPGETAAELIRLAPDKIIIVGGTAVVSPAVEDGLKGYAGTVERIAGANRYETAAKLSAATFPATSDTTEIKIRYSDESFSVDMASGIPAADKVKCVTSPVTFDGATSVVASGGLSLDPIGTPWSTFHGYVDYSNDGGSTWTHLNGAGLKTYPADGIHPAAVPINAANNLSPGTYNFAVMIGATNHQAAPGAVDHDGSCELTITAYTGQGASTDFVSTSAG